MVSIANDQITKFYNEIRKDVREVASKWAEILKLCKEFHIATDPRDILWKRTYWDFIPGETEFRDECYCLKPTEGEKN